MTDNKYSVHLSKALSPQRAQALRLVADRQDRARLMMSLFKDQIVPEVKALAKAVEGYGIETQIRVIDGKMPDRKPPSATNREPVQYPEVRFRSVSNLIGERGSFIECGVHDDFTVIKLILQPSAGPGGALQPPEVVSTTHDGFSSDWLEGHLKRFVTDVLRSGEQ
mgnify:FL=1